MEKGGEIKMANYTITVHVVAKDSKGDVVAGYEYGPANFPADEIDDLETFADELAKFGARCRKLAADKKKK